MRDFPLHTALTIALLGAGLVGQALWPAKPPKAVAPPPAPAPVAAPSIVTPRPAALLEDSAGELDHFYQALRRTESKEAGAITRIVHYGDSPLLPT